VCVSVNYDFVTILKDFPVHEQIITDLASPRVMTGNYKVEGSVQMGIAVLRLPGGSMSM